MSTETLVKIRAEAGGVDATDFAEMLLRMYHLWSLRHGYPVEVLDTSRAEVGIKATTLRVEAPSAMLNGERGMHRLVRISPFDRQQRRQTAFASVAIGGAVAWGDQVRSYVLHPYQLVKDLRTGYEVGNPQTVLDGGIDGFIEASRTAVGDGS